MKFIIGILSLSVFLLRGVEAPAGSDERVGVAPSKKHNALQPETLDEIKNVLVSVYADSVRKNVLTKRELKTAKEVLPFLLQNQLFKGYVKEDLSDAVGVIIKEIDSVNGALLPQQALSAVVMDMLHLLIPQYPMTVVSLRIKGEAVDVVLEWPEEAAKHMVLRVRLPEEYTDLVRAMQLYSSQFGEPYFKLLGLILYLAEQENRPVEVSGDVFDGWSEEEERQPMMLQHLFGAHNERSRKERGGLLRRKSRKRRL